MKAHFLRVVFALTGIFIFGCHALAGPLDNWHWRNPLPNGNYGSFVADAYVINGITFTNGTFFGAASYGVVATSVDGMHWMTNSTPTTNQLNDIIYASGGFIAVGNEGTVETSVDGTNWVLQDSGTSANLSSVAYGNGKYAAAGGGVVIASPDGVHWTAAASNLNGAGLVAGSSAGFVALVGDQDFFSTDGLNWTTNTLTVPVSGYAGEPLQVQILTCFNGDFLIGSYIYVTSGSADMFMFSSPDGIHWTTNFVGTAYTGALSFGYSFFMTGNPQAVANGYAEFDTFLQYSSDGATWVQTNISASIYQLPQHNTAGAYGNGTYVITSPIGISVSQDGLNWTNVGNLVSMPPPPPVGPANTISSIAYSNGTYVATSSGGFVASTNDSVYAIESNTPALLSVTPYGDGFAAVGSSGEIYTSPTGFSWTQRTSGTTSNLRSVATGSSLLVAVGDDGAVQTSSSGLAWTSRTSGTSLILYGVTYSDSQYVAVGQQGTVVTSPDGINWTVQYSGTLSNLIAVAYGSAGFLAVGAGGTVITSPDGENWTSQNAGTSTSLTSATFGNGYYLVTGTNALVLTSPDGVNWTSRNVGATLGQNLYGSGFLNGRFDVVGSDGTILESDPVAPLFDIQIQGAPQQNVLTVFITPGSTFRIQDCANLANPVWSTVATFNNAAAITQWTNTVTGLNPCYFRAISP